MPTTGLWKLYSQKRKEEAAQQRKALAVLIETKSQIRDMAIRRAPNGAAILLGMKSADKTERQNAYKSLVEAEATSPELKKACDDLHRYQIMAAQLDRVAPPQRVL